MERHLVFSLRNVFLFYKYKKYRLENIYKILFSFRLTNRVCYIINIIKITQIIFPSKQMMGKYYTYYTYHHHRHK